MRDISTLLTHSTATTPATHRPVQCDREKTYSGSHPTPSVPPFLTESKTCQNITISTLHREVMPNATTTRKLKIRPCSNHMIIAMLWVTVHNGVHTGVFLNNGEAYAASHQPQKPTSWKKTHAFSSLRKLTTFLSHELNHRR